MFLINVPSSYFKLPEMLCVLRDVCGAISSILFPSLPESIMETCSVVLTFESVDKILWCDHSNETSSAVLLHGTICFFNILQKRNLRVFHFDFRLSCELKDCQNERRNRI